MNSRKVKSNYGFGRQFEMACLGLARHGRQAALSATLLSILSVASISFGAQPIPGKIEAESFVAQSGIETESTGDVGGGLNVGWVDAGDWMDYSVDVTVAGRYTVEWRLAGPGGGGVIQLRQNDTPMSSVTSPNTGDWQIYQTVSNTVTFSQTGVQTLRVYAVSGGWNFNWMNFVKTSDPFIVNNAQTATSVSTSQATLNGALAMAFDTNTTSVTVYWGTTDGGTTAGNWTGGTNTWAAPQSVGVPLAYVASGFATNTAYFFRFYAADATTNDWADATATWITAPVTLSTISNASEAGLVPGVFRVTRPSSVTAGALVVNYTVSGGDAVAGQNYVELSGSVTILAGQTSADISVEPIADWKSKDDKTLSISLIETDSYLVDSGSSSSQITIQNLNIPYSYPTNVWIGDGDAAYSNAWHLGHMPTSEETVLLADIYSSGDITWNCNGGANGLTNTVNEWLQTTNYTGSVIIPTTYEFNSTTFTNFIVLSDMVIAGGKVQCPYNNPTDDIGGNAYYILKLKVEGDLIIKDLGSINVYARGYEGSGPGKFWLGGIDRAAYGGSSGQAWNNSEFGTNTYGSILKPWALGSAGQDYNSFGNGGGGAVWLEVAGNTQVDAEILANGFDTQWGGGTGGSIYLKTATLSGTGTIMSNGGNGINSINQIGSAGGGGRVSVNLTDGSNTGSVVITAYGNGVEDKYKTGAGTVFVKTVDNLGLIKVDNNNISAYDETLTHIPAFRANAGYNNVPMITKDTPEELEGMDVSVTRRARVHFTEDLNLNTVDVDTSAVVYLDGHTITVQSFTDGDTVYASAGEYTADELNRFLDPDGTGKIVIEAVGTVLILQ